MFQVTQIVRFRVLLEALRGGLRFRNLGFCGHDVMETATFNAPVPVYPEGLAFFPPFLEGHASGAFVCRPQPQCDQDDLALTVRIRLGDLNRRFGGLQVSPRLRFACSISWAPTPFGTEALASCS